MKGNFILRQTKAILPFLVLVEILRALHYTDAAYFITRTSLLLFLLPAYLEIKKSKRFKVFVVLVVIFSLWALLTTIWSEDFIVTLPRSIYFGYVVIAAAACGYFWSETHKNSVLEFMVPSNILIIAVSLFSLISNLPSDAWTGGCGIGFKGFAPHQNTFGMMLLFTIPSVIFSLIILVRTLFSGGVNENKKSNPNLILKIIFYSILSLLNIYFLIISHSRASILSLLVIAAVFLSLVFRLKIFLSIVFSAGIFIAAVLFFIPEINKQAIEYVYKTENKFGDRRAWLVKHTITAALNGGMIGLGYGVSDPQFKPPDFKIIDGQRYYREKVVGALALVEEVGIIGLGIYLSFLGYILLNLLKTIVRYKKQKIITDNFGGLKHSFLFSVIIGLVFNTQIEAWWQGAGSWQFFLFFLIVGSALAHVSFYKSDLKIEER